MTYASIATILYTNKLESSALEYAILCARQWNAHLHVLCMGVDHSEVPSYFAAGEVIALKSNLAASREEAAAIATAGKERLSREVIAWDSHAAALSEAGLKSFLTERLRYQDMIVLPRPYDSQGGHLVTDVFEASLFEAHRPVLSAPRGQTPVPQFERVMVAWDDGPEALASIRQALPLLAKARHVDLTMVGPAGSGAEDADPCARVAAYLAHHGAPVEVNMLPRVGNSVSAQLMQRAREQEIDLVVMGGYGHSRMREALFGGASRDMLETCETPILMAHQG